ncbi:hypothetical protein PV648_02465 [Streptomyces sp. ID05-47C]|nr:hypothetical protein [Streptomyces sp. ID05-47C]MDX3568202.1 hypothetical protein [Streptomyces sp. ID05-47C]
MVAYLGEGPKPQLAFCGFGPFVFGSVVFRSAQCDVDAPVGPGLPYDDFGAAVPAQQLGDVMFE